MEPAEAADRARDAAALWSVGYVTSAELVEAACDLLVTGHDGTTLAMLAGVRSRDADMEVPELLEAALSDVGLVYYPPGSRAGAEAAVKTLARRVLTGAMEPSALTVWAYQTFGPGTLELADRLVELDDAYDFVEFSDTTEQDLDAEVIAEARRIVTPADLKPGSGRGGQYQARRLRAGRGGDDAGLGQVRVSAEGRLRRGAG
ncbi:hypothetical protein [Paractinoplanes atraurantiacus]|uniref:hypothetical protein n=1 Tax=Paractinoplanes atraurantiacus TaxID=1036182 RepID=UPI000BE2AB87|nr:hypothetical protein [Actinoplanes atraurantiacus]